MAGFLLSEKDFKPPKGRRRIQGKPFSEVSALGSSAGTAPKGIFLQHIPGTGGLHTSTGLRASTALEMPKVPPGAATPNAIEVSQSHFQAKICPSSSQNALGTTDLWVAGTKLSINLTRLARDVH